MSYQAPTSSFGGPCNYTQQWPASNPSPSTSVPPSMPQIFPFNQNQMPTYQQSHDSARYPLEYNGVNFTANARLPGLGAPGPVGSLPPPPFPFIGNYTPSQFPPPPPFPPMQIPPLRYPPVPAPTAPINTPPSHSLTNDFQSQPNLGSVTNTHPQRVTSSFSRQELDREEGELSDGEEVRSQQETESRPHMSSPSSKRGAQQNTHLQMVNGKRNINETDCKDYPPRHSQCTSSEVEEGEASSQGSRSSRDSGSPYNPPISVNVEPFVSAPIVDNENTPKPRSQGLSAKSTFSPTADSQTTPSGGRSPAQLRVQAQGALLSLAPHNIRYSELVGEGINPTILKQLYEEVGIKVPTPQPDTASTQVPSQPSTMRGYLVTDSTAPITNSPSQETKGKQAAEAIKAANIAKSTGSAENSSTHVPSSHPGTSKPMERKEVIARMLAAKAAKSSGTPPSPEGDKTKEPPIPGSSTTTDSEKTDDALTSTETPSQEKEVRVREKNKAQTELARQRIEQLKKQGLMRMQQKSTPDDSSLGNAQLNTNPMHDSTPSLNSPSIQHPLPERPPDPEASAFARIPGLFMTEVELKSPEEPYLAPTPGLVIDSTPQPRVNQRKRPRASDFDEPVSMPRKAYNNGVNHSVAGEKLIIDISDDDLYEDDEDDAMEIETLGENAGPFLPHDPTRAYLSAEFLPARPLTSSSQGVSLSATPQYPKSHDQEDLRKKDLEIQAMHKRIAELEQRKKAKLAASRTQSPRVMDSSESSPPETSPPADTKIPDDSGHFAAAATEGDSSQDNNMDALQSTTTTPGLYDTLEDIPSRLDSMNAEQLENMECKALRKREIESGIPVLDAEILKSETKLAEFNLEQERLLLEITKGKEGRQQLLEELSNLNTELNGVSLEEVESALNRLETKEQQLENEARTAKLDISDGKDNGTSDSSEAEILLQERTGCTHEPSRETPADTGNRPHLSDVNTDYHDLSEASRESTPSSDSTGSSMDESSDDDSDGSLSIDQGESKAQSSIPDVDMSEGLDEVQDTNQVEANMVNEAHNHSLPGRPQSTNLEIRSDDSSSSSEQAIEMTEDQASDKSTVSEAYEPPEPEANASPADSVYTPLFSPASPGPIEPTVSRSPITKSQITGELPMGSIHEPGFSQRGEGNQVGLLDNVRQPGDSDHTFSPYISPLKSFKAYRYHPNYTDEVTGGYRSLTYSHNIDPMVYLCPFEGAGGVCNDRSCEFQHFRDMTLSDDKILVQMGSLREGKTAEEKDSYIAGLKSIINDMRRDKVKDFNTVAAEIAAYRRRFLQDPSRVLPL
ncbi:hypothetical protein BDV28DRAFT_134537 [Aspergillus coremiiformis]|uniref:Putative zinc-finger domain-containing protein n=1 Tax=Aspergillus coremiiformis TaxID=138285 RepID=A0A5N6Z556_9EURO|nr:hypothetical protein BDV28DRAFT_134537 [Aspergillus coremiiformis]